MVVAAAIPQAFFAHLYAMKIILVAAGNATSSKMFISSKILKIYWSRYAFGESRDIERQWEAS